MNVQQEVSRVIEIQAWLVAWLARELEVEANDIGLDEEFINLGLSSRQAVLMSGELEDWLGLTLDPSLAWEYPTIAQLSTALAAQTAP